MKTKTIKVYKYDELNEKAKEKVLNYFRENNKYYFLEENLNESLNELLKKNNIKQLGDLKLRYSLGYCQGDGLSFIGNFEYKGFNVKIELGSLSNLYSHSKTTNIYIQDEKGEDASENVYNEFESIYLNICKILEKEGYEYIENEDSEKSIKENIEINEYTFRENGEMENI